MSREAEERASGARNCGKRSKVRVRSPCNLGNMNPSLLYSNSGSPQIAYMCPASHVLSLIIANAIQQSGGEKQSDRQPQGHGGRKLLSRPPNVLSEPFLVIQLSAESNTA